MTETDCPDYLTRPCTCEPACCPHCPHDQAVPLPPLVDPAAWRRGSMSGSPARDLPCPDPYCDGSAGHDGPHFAWIPE